MTGRVEVCVLSLVRVARHGGGWLGSGLEDASTRIAHIFFPFIQAVVFFSFALERWIALGIYAFFSLLSRLGKGNKGRGKQ